MPWATSDVEGHIKGLSDHQKTVWVAVANRALAACVKDGGSDATCAPKAIRQANAVAQKAPKVKVAAMANKTIGGKSYSASDFLVVEDPAQPSTWHLQVKRNGKPDHGLMGGAWAALHGGYRGNQYSGPNKADALRKLIALYKSEGLPTPTAMAAFSVELAAAGEKAGASVIRRGKLFQAGDYPDKQFAMTPDELAAAVDAFFPVPLDSEHRESVFDGQLGEVEAIELCEDGAALCGAVRIPDWLDQLFPNTPIPVSTTWDRETKTLTGLALAKNPRVSDAAILAAFAQHNTYEGRGTLQGIHDMAARAGATCQMPARSAGMNSAHENASIQAIHDMAAQHGATCSAMGDRYASYVDTFAAFAGKRHNQSDQAALDAAHEAIVKAGATCAGARMNKESRMKVFDKEWWAALFGGAQEAGLEVAEFDKDDPPPAPQPDLVLKAEVDKLKDQNAKLLRVQIEGQAAVFADGAVRDHRALPAEWQSLYDAYLQAAQDDDAHGGVTFADNTQGTRVGRLEALVAARPQHSLTVEQVVTNDAVALGNGGGDKATMSEERHDALLAITPLGQAALDRKRARSA